MLAAYQKTKGQCGEGWETKDSAVYLLAVVATRGSTSQVSLRSFSVRMRANEGVAWGDEYK